MPKNDEKKNVEDFVDTLTGKNLADSGLSTLRVRLLEEYAVGTFENPSPVERMLGSHYGLKRNRCDLSDTERLCTAEAGRRDGARGETDVVQQHSFIASDFDAQYLKFTVFGALADQRDCS